MSRRLVIPAVILLVGGCARPIDGPGDSPGGGDDASQGSSDDSGGSSSTGDDATSSGDDGSGGEAGTSGGKPDAGGTPSGEGGSPVNRTAAQCNVDASYGSALPGGLTMYECDPTGMEGKTAQAAPLVLALHGYTQGAYEAPPSSWTPAAGEPTQWGYINTTQWATLAETYKFYVVFPSTGNATNASQADTSVRSFYWYESFYVTRNTYENQDAADIVSMVQAMQKAHNIDPSRIFISGLSAGAGMANLMLACYPDVFAGGASFEGVAVGCDTSCAALGKAPPNGNWTWPGNHPASDITNCDPSWWSDASKPKPKLLVFQGGQDGAVTPQNMSDIVQQFAGALGISTTPASTGTLSGQEYTTYGSGQLATVFMPNIGHGTPVQPGPPSSSPPYYVVGAPPAADQGGWDPVPSLTMVDNANLVQDWTNTTGIYGPYYAAKFWGIIP
jgi:poly(hydroxyalkanoate) depolymerase family esterase